MCVTEHQGAEFHDADESGEIENFGVRVSAIENAGKVEEFGALIDLCPETLFEGLFCIAKDGGFFDEVKVR